MNTPWQVQRPQVERRLVVASDYAALVAAAQAYLDLLLEWADIVPLEIAQGLEGVDARHWPAVAAATGDRSAGTWLFGSDWRLQ